MRRRILFHRVSAIVWILLLIPALLWWRESLWFVIVASVYANVKSDWGAAEAADDRDLAHQLRALELKVDRLLERVTELQASTDRRQG